MDITDLVVGPLMLLKQPHNLSFSYHMVSRAIFAIRLANGDRKVHDCECHTPVGWANLVKKSTTNSGEAGQVFYCCSLL